MRQKQYNFHIATSHKKLWIRIIKLDYILQQ